MAESIRIRTTKEQEAARKDTHAKRMDIKIGLADSPRELIVRLPEGQDDVIGLVERALAIGQQTLKLEDDKGHQFLIRTDRVIYVEQGSAAARSVGFMR